MAETFKCQMCPLVHNAKNKAMIHALKVHKNEKRFLVKCLFDSCTYTTDSWPNFRKHCNRNHMSKTANLHLLSDNDVEEHDNLRVEEVVDIDVPSVDPDSVSSSFNLSLAKFVLSLETQHHVTRRGLADITGAIEDLTEQLSLKVQSDVQTALELDQNADVCGVIAESCRVQTTDLSHDYGRHKIYKEKFHYLEPLPVRVGGNERCIAHYVPLADLLQLLCSQEQIWKCIKRQTPTNDGANLMRDFEDATFLQNHPLTISGDLFLQLVLYYDDIEMQNPLRSNKRHKLAMFYVSILNIPPLYRSQLQNIFSIAIAPVHLLKKYGFVTVLEDFLHTVRRLSREGIAISRGNQKFNLRGDLIAALGDNPAAAALGGFKESTSASRMCRTCMATKETFKGKHYVNDFVQRNVASYNDQCKLLEDPALHNRKAFWSKAYGINERSCLCAIPDFDVTKRLLQDPMHVILEGTLPYVLALFLQHFIYKEGLFSLQELNTFLLRGSDFKQERRDVFVPIEAKHIKKDQHIKQKASCMLVLSYILPFFLGQYLDETDPRYRNLLCLIRITCMCFKPVVDETCVGVLTEDISDFLSTFCEIYTPDKMKPKMHFMLHFPCQMQEFGPLRHHSTMRPEGKHQEFKNHRWMNFNNLPHSLLKRHQLNLAHALTDSQGNIVTNFLQAGAGTGSTEAGRSINVFELEEPLQHILIKNFRLNKEEVLQESQTLTWRGRRYDTDCCILLSECELNGPCFGKILALYSRGGACYAWLQVAKTSGFCAAFNAYRIELESSFTRCVDLSVLPINWPVPVRNVDGELYVVNRYGVSC